MLNGEATTSNFGFCHSKRPADTHFLFPTPCTQTFIFSRVPHEFHWKSSHATSRFLPAHLRESFIEGFLALGIQPGYIDGFSPLLVLVQVSFDTGST